MSTASVRVPADFVGMSSAFVRIPSSVTVNFTRSWDFYGSLGWPNRCNMNILNPSAGTYMWTPLDDFAAAAVGRSVVMTLGQPADYLVSRAAIGGAYTGGKANMCPDDLSGWGTAVQAVVSRLKNVWGRTGLHWELWNEIDSAPSYGDSISLLGPYTRVTAQAILAIDPTAKIMAPSTGLGSSTAFNTWVAAADGAGGTSKDWVSEANYHVYENYALGVTDGQYHPVAIVNQWNASKAALRTAGVDWPVYITEAGYTMQEPQQALDHQRAMLTLAALGAKAYIGYQYDDATNFGIQGISAQWNTVAGLLGGSPTISKLVLNGFRVTATINGIDYTY